MPTVGTLLVNVLANTTGLTAGLGRARVQVFGFGKGLKGLNLAGLTRGLGGAGAAAGALGASFAAAAAAAAALVPIMLKLHGTNEKIQRSMNHSLALLQDVTEYQRDTMTQVAIDVAGKTTFSTSQVADAYYELASANMDAQQSMEAMPAVAEFAMAGNFGLAKATKLLAGSLYGLGLNSVSNEEQLKNTKMISDKLVKVTTMAQTTTEKFAESLTASSGALRSVGKGIDDGLPVLAALARLNIEGAEAGTALQIVFREMKFKADDNAEAFDKFKVKVFDANGEMNSMADIFGDLEKAMAHKTTQEKVSMMTQMGFQKKSLRFIELLSGQAAVMNEVSEALKTNADGTSEWGGTAKKVAESQMTPFQESVKQLKRQWDLLAVSTGTITELFTYLIDKLTELLHWFQKAYKPDGWGEELFGDSTPLWTFLDALHRISQALRILWNGMQFGVAGVVLAVGTLLQKLAELQQFVMEKMPKWMKKRMFPGWDEYNEMGVEAYKGFNAAVNEGMDKQMQDFINITQEPLPSVKLREKLEKDAAATDKAKEALEKLRKEQAKLLAAEKQAAIVAARVAAQKKFMGAAFSGLGKMAGKVLGEGVDTAIGETWKRIVEHEMITFKAPEPDMTRGRTNAALELGSMEAYKAARLTNASDPQRKIAFNTTQLVDIAKQQLRALKLPPMPPLDPVAAMQGKALGDLSDKTSQLVDVAKEQLGEAKKTAGDFVSGIFKGMG